MVRPSFVSGPPNQNVWMHELQDAGGGMLSLISELQTDQ